jgi:hypothetical protein
MANKKKSEIEDQILSLMERIEKAQQESKQVQSHLLDAERTFTQEQKKLQALADHSAVELARLEEKRKDVTRVLEKDLLERYNKLKAIRKDLALAPVRSGICFGCRLQLPPQLVAEVKRSDILQTCSYCHRILYCEDDTAPSAAVVGAQASQPDEDRPKTN